MIRAIIFDYAYTIYDPEKNGFQRDVRPTLEELMKVCKLILISRTTDIEARLKQIDEVGFQLYFDYVDVIGKDDKKDFSKVLNHYNFKPDEYLVVGDRITSEITQGNKLGMKTCRFLYGPEKNLVPENDLETPNYTIEKLSEVISLV